VDTAIMHRRLEVEELYRREVVLLQAGRYMDWLDCFTEDMRYRAPVVRVADHRSEVVAGENELAYYDETLDTMRLRARKLASTLAWTEYPPSRLRYFVQVLELDEADDGLLEVTSNVLCYQTRHDDVEHFFFALRRDRLRRTGDTWKVAHRSVEIDRSRLPSENLAVFL
jgi:3-phenylpropionate/cinnamic acid dioxygenase small subunit